MATGTKITDPLSCACPTKKQSRQGVKYLLSYLIAEDNDNHSSDSYAETPNKLSNHHTTASPVFAAADSSSCLAHIGHSLKVYELEDLQSATENFSPQDKIGGTVYYGSIEGTAVAIKKMERDIRKEISILKTVNHFKPTGTLSKNMQKMGS
ncbi:hypothetical protein ACLOJK_003279 [Asimina triloba]